MRLRISLRSLAIIAASLPSSCATTAARTARPSEAPTTTLEPVAQPTASAAPTPERTRMLSGLWTDAPPADRAAVSFDASSGSLTFVAPSGVGFDDPVRPDNDGALRVSATIDPVRDDTQSLGWIAFVLTPERDGAGWPTNRGHVAAILVRSNGAIQVFSQGNEREARWEQQPPAPASQYRVALALRVAGGELVLEGAINEGRFASRLGGERAALGGRPLFLDLCAHYHEAPTESRVSELRAGGSTLW